MPPPSVSRRRFRLTHHPWKHRIRPGREDPLSWGKGRMGEQTTTRRPPVLADSAAAVAANRSIRAIDLFCGAGGSSWGARAAGVQVVAAFDLWPLAGAVYSANFPDVRFFEGRLEEMDVEETAAGLGQIDLILASPECTSHSLAKGNKPRCEVSRNTAFQVVRFADALKPRWIVVENVISMRKWSRYEEFTAQLREAGYNTHEQLLNSADFGVPQSRRRLFILCDRERKPDPVAKAEEGRPAMARDIVNLDGAYRWSPLRAPRRAKATLERADRGIAVVGARKPFLLVYYGSDRAGGWQTLDRPLRTITTLDRFAVVKPSPSGHVMRMLQVPELRAAMGMPPEMEFEHGSRRDRIKMIGNAVCPPVMREVVSSLLRNGRRVH